MPWCTASSAKARSGPGPFAVWSWLDSTAESIVWRSAEIIAGTRATGRGGSHCEHLLGLAQVGHRLRQARGVRERAPLAHRRPPPSGRLDFGLSKYWMNFQSAPWCWLALLMTRSSPPREAAGGRWQMGRVSRPPCLRCGEPLASTSGKQVGPIDGEGGLAGIEGVLNIRLLPSGHRGWGDLELVDRVLHELESCHVGRGVEVSDVQGPAEATQKVLVVADDSFVLGTLERQALLQLGVFFMAASASATNCWGVLGGSAQGPFGRRGPGR